MQWRKYLYFVDIDQLITISGMVIRSSQLIPEMQEAFFKCQVCAFTTRVEIDRGRIAEPSVCKHCNTTHSMALIHNRSMFSDKQMVRCTLIVAKMKVFSFCSLTPNTTSSITVPFFRLKGWKRAKCFSLFSHVEWISESVAHTLEKCSEKMKWSMYEYLNVSKWKSLYI